MDNGGGTPSSSARVLEAATISPVFEAEPVKPAINKPTKLSASSGTTFALPLQRSATGMTLRSSGSVPPSGSVASAPHEPPPLPVETPPPAPPSPMGVQLSCHAWEHLLSGGPAPLLPLRTLRHVRRAQVDADSLDITLFGRLDVTATQNAKAQGFKGRVMAFTDLGQQCRDFLGDVTVRDYYATLSAAPVPSSRHLAASPASLGESPVDPALLGLSALHIDRQNVMILSMMLAHMTDSLVKVYQDYATPADIFLDIRRWDSDSLSSEVPLLMGQLRDAVMRPEERVDEFFQRVRGYCSDLRSARSPVAQDYDMGIIIGGIRMARFDSLRLKFGMMRQRQIPEDYWQY
eukprot:gene4912-biopygen15218